MEISGEKNCLSVKTENGKFLSKRRIFLEMTTQWKRSSLMHSLLSEHYLYWRKETQCGISYLAACLKKKKKKENPWADIHSLQVGRLGYRWDKGWRLQTIALVICILLVYIKLNYDYICFKQKCLAGAGKAVWNIKRIFKLVFLEWNH